MKCTLSATVLPTSDIKNYPKWPTEIVANYCFKLQENVDKVVQIKKRHTLWITPTLLVTLTLIVYITVSVRIYLFSHKTHNGSADVAVVLGAAVWSGKPSPVLRERINHAVSLQKNGRVNYLIFTGGVGEGDTISEAQVSGQYAIEQGVPKEVIFYERTSKITVENIVEAGKIIKSRGFKDVVIVSDPLHMKRAVKMANDNGLNAFSSPTKTSLYRSNRVKLKFLISEAYFYISYSLFG